MIKLLNISEDIRIHRENISETRSMYSREDLFIQSRRMYPRKDKDVSTRGKSCI